MKIILTILAVLTLLEFSAAAMAQDAEAACEPAAINTAIDKLVAAYLGDRLEAEDTVGALQAAENLQTAIAEVVAGCEGTVGEGIPAIEPSGEINSSILTQGKWMLNWSFESQTCPGTDFTVTATTRPVIVRVDLQRDRIIFEDVFIFGSAEFSPNAQGNYNFLRNLTADDGSPFSYDYVISKVEAGLIEGATIDYYSWIDCNLTNPFQLVLIDENIVCMAGSDSGSNLRSGPGTDFDRLGALAAGEQADVIGQATGSDGFVWWQLADESWVRSDLVEEAGLCESVPEVAT